MVPIQEIGGPNARNRVGPIRGNQVVPIQEIDWSLSEEIPQPAITYGIRSDWQTESTIEDVESTLGESAQLTTMVCRGGFSSIGRRL